MAELTKETVIEELNELENSMRGLDDEIVDRIVSIRSFVLKELGLPTQPAQFTFSDLLSDSPLGLYCRDSIEGGGRLLVVSNFNNDNKRYVLYVPVHRTERMELAICSLWKDQAFIREENKRFHFKIVDAPFEEDLCRYSFGDLSTVAPEGLYSCNELSSGGIYFLVIGNTNEEDTRAVMFLYSDEYSEGDDKNKIEVAHVPRWRDSVFFRKTDKKFEFSLDNV